MTPSRWFFLRLLVLTFGITLLGIVDVGAQATYVPVGPVSTPDPQEFFSVESPNTCSDSSQTLPHRGYVKAETDVKIDGLISNTGHCDVYISKKYYTTHWRDLTYIYWSHTPPGGLTYNLLYSAGIRPDVDPQVYDTRNPGAGNPGTTRSTDDTGKWVFTFRGGQSSTNCGFANSSNTITRHLNVVACAPAFTKVGELHPRLPATQIQIWTALSGNDIDVAIDQAASAWNNRLPSGPPSFIPATEDCGTGPMCVRVVEDSSLSDCSMTNTTTADPTTGVINGTVQIRLNPNWRNFGFVSVKLILAHELGHWLGLADRVDDTPTACSNDNSVMHSPLLNCSDDEANSNPTETDARAVEDGVYGGGPEVACGF